MLTVYGIFQTSEGFEVQAGVVTKRTAAGMQVKFENLKRPFYYSEDQIGKTVFLELEKAERLCRSWQMDLEERKYIESTWEDPNG